MEGSSESLAESIMLSRSSSEPGGSVAPSWLEWWSSTSSSFSSSSFCRFRRSISTLTPSPSPVSASTTSHTRFLSRVSGTFLRNLSSRKLGSLSSSLLLWKRSSRLVLSNAFLRMMWSFCLFSRFPVLNGSVDFEDGVNFLGAIGVARGSISSRKRVKDLH